MSNPGNTILYTANGQSSPLVLTLTNPYNLTPTWSYPTITGVTWTPSNTGITAVAAQGTSYATTTITVQASYSTYNYPQSFSFTISAAPYVQGIVTTLITGLHQPTGVLHDKINTLYIPDTYLTTINKVNATTLSSTQLVSVKAHNTAYDGSTYLYATDHINHVIYKINASTGTYVTLAGTAGSSGSADGTGAAARFYFPTGITYDSAGFLYVTDTNNSTIRKITTAGVVTTIAGTAGSTGSADGTGTAAQFLLPYGLVYDGSANIYIADSYNHTIRQMVKATGVVTTIAGQAGVQGTTDGNGTSALFSSPLGITYDSGNYLLFIGDTTYSTIRRFSVITGAVTTVAGVGLSSGNVDGTGSAARFNQPQGLSYYNGVLYVADSNNNSIRKIT